MTMERLSVNFGNIKCPMAPPAAECEAEPFSELQVKALPDESCFEAYLRGQHLLLEKLVMATAVVCPGCEFMVSVDRDEDRAALEVSRRDIAASSGLHSSQSGSDIVADRICARPTSMPSHDSGARRTWSARCRRARCSTYRRAGGTTCSRWSGPSPSASGGSEARVEHE